MKLCKNMRLRQKMKMWLKNVLKIRVKINKKCKYRRRRIDQFLAYSWLILRNYKGTIMMQSTKVKTIKN